MANFTSSDNPGYQNRFQQLGRRVRGPVKSYLSSRPHQTGIKWTKDLWGFGKRTPGIGGFIGKFAGPAWLVGSAAYGMSQEGLWGGVKALAGETAWTYGLGVGIKALGSAMGSVGTGVAIAGGAAAAVGYGMGYRPSDMFRPWVNDYMKRHDRLELATPNLDVFGTVSTMRQRSIQAIQNSKLNGRAALGSEATLTYQPYMR